MLKNTLPYNCITLNTNRSQGDRLLGGIEPAKALPEFNAQPISDEAKRKILWDNAVKLYGQRLVT